MESQKSPGDSGKISDCTTDLEGGLFHGMKLDDNGLPEAQGLYNPQYEKDACGVGFVVNITGEATRKVSSIRNHASPQCTSWPNELAALLR